MSNSTVLVLRCVHEDMTSRGNDQVAPDHPAFKTFKWPESGPVECFDWDPEPVCGFGLHGWLWGEGDISICSYWNEPTNKWLVVEVDSTLIVQFEGKCKFPSGIVVYSGDRAVAVSMVADRAPAGTRVMFRTATAGDGGTISIKWWNKKRGRYRRVVAEIDSEGFYKPGIAYVVNENGQLVAK